MLEQHVPDDDGARVDRAGPPRAARHRSGRRLAAALRRLADLLRAACGDGPGRHGLRGPAPRRLRAARLHRPPDGVEPDVPILIVTLARPELLERRPDWGAGKRSFTSIYLEPLAGEPCASSSPASCPGCRWRPSRRDRGPRRRHPALRGRDRPHAPGAGPARARGRRSTARPATSTDLAVPETLTALIAARLDGLEAADREPRRGRGRPRPELHAGRPGGGLRRAASRSSSRGCAALVRRELLVQRRGPALARARPVRLRPGAHPRGRLQHAGQEGPQGPPPRGGALLRDARHRRAGRRARRPLPRRAGLAADGPEADALAAQARIALRGAAERAAALGSHAQAIAFLEQALEVTPDPTDRADLHERALASAMQGLVGEVAERHGLGALEAKRELGAREAIALAAAAYGDAIWLFSGDQDRLQELVLPAWEEFSRSRGDRGRRRTDDAAVELLRPS